MERSGWVKHDSFADYIYPVIHQKSKYLIHKRECVKPLLALQWIRVVFPLLFSVFPLHPLPQHAAILSFCFHVYNLSRIRVWSTLSWLRLHASPHLLVSETPQGSPFKPQEWKRGSGDEEDFSSSDRFRILKASNQRSQTKEAAASHHGQSITGLLYFQSDADWFSCCLWGSEQLNV